MMDQRLLDGPHSDPGGGQPGGGRQKRAWQGLEAERKFYLPVDCVVADRLDKQAETKIIPVQEVPKDWLIADIGPATVTLFGEALQNAENHCLERTQ